MEEATVAQAGLKKEDIYKIVIDGANKNNNVLKMSEIYDLINEHIKVKNLFLSEQGKHSLRKIINTDAVKDGFLYPYDKNNPGWRLTPKALEVVSEENLPAELIYNQITQQEEKQIPNVIRGKLFEDYCLKLLKVIYPFYSWYHQGIHKNNERGLDLIAEKIGEINTEYKSLGVQIKLHQENSSPTKEEWLKYLAGCFVRNIDKAIFITTGKLTSEQRREAGEAKITVIEGKNELDRIANEYNFDIYEE